MIQWIKLKDLGNYNFKGKNLKILITKIKFNRKINNKFNKYK